MSKEQPQTKEEWYAMARENWDDEQGEFVVAFYPSFDPSVDVLAVYVSDEEATPVVIVPTSERAKYTFKRWGWLEWQTGIQPPEDAMDLITSMPLDWVLRTQLIKKGAHIIKEVPLPQPLMVVH